VLAHRGLLAASAELYRSLSPAAALLGVPALVATGALADALTTAAVAGKGPCAAVGRRGSSGADAPVADRPAAAERTAGATGSPAGSSEHRDAPGCTDRRLGAHAGGPGTPRATDGAAPRYPDTAAGPPGDALAGWPVDGREYPGAQPGWLVGGREYIDVPDAPPVARHPGPAGGPAPGTLLGSAAELMAAGMIETVTGSAPAALSRLCRAAGLLEPVASGVLLPDTPAALTAVVARQCGELSVAADALRRAVEGRHGGRMAQLRHRLLHGWVLLDSGRAGAVARLLDRLSRPDVRLEPRDELVAAALGVAVARRAESPGALVATWARARDALVRHPVELCTLRELGELAVAAAALGEADRLAAHLDEADRLLDRLGRPPLWCAPLHWARLQAAVAAGCADEVERRVQALAGLATTSPYAAVLHAAGTAWSRLLAGSVDPDALIALGRRMQPVGLGWEAARLVAAAAPLVPERRAAAAMHAFARGLGAGPDGPEEATPAAAPDDAPTFSERELEIGRLILAGLTYKQIGPRLYISAKTVEHHVARMRQRLGVASRDELFDALRAALG
jgi:DNA-binding NarL/FixJ family response regulator